MSNEEQLISLNEIEADEDRAQLLPAIVGFTSEHKVITNELVRRVVSLLREHEFKVTSQTAAEDYCGNFEESLRLVLGDKIKLSLTLTTIK